MLFSTSIFRAKIKRLPIKTALITLSCLSCLCLSCKGDNPPSGKAAANQKLRKLTILSLEEIQKAGFFKHVIPAFETNHSCQVELITVASSSDLWEYLQERVKTGKVDIVAGLDNCLQPQTADMDIFAEETIPSTYALSSNIIMDNKKKLIPYGFGYLAFIYNEQKLPNPPESFGELQDSRFFNQMAIHEPRFSGKGRASYYWTLALFGDAGYQQFWKSIKKNIFVAKPTWNSMFDGLKRQECSICFGFTTTPAWYLETAVNPLPLKAIVPKEGSYLYVEAAAIPKKAKHRDTAEIFLRYLLSPDVQRFVALDLGMFPANAGAPLPPQFSVAPNPGFGVNDKLKQENPREQTDTWLDFWDKLFSTSLISY